MLGNHTLKRPVKKYKIVKKNINIDIINREKLFDRSANHK